MYNRSSHSLNVWLIGISIILFITLNATTQAEDGDVPDSYRETWSKICKNAQTFKFEKTKEIANDLKENCPEWADGDRRCVIDAVELFNSVVQQVQNKFIGLGSAQGSFVKLDGEKMCIKVSDSANMTTTWGELNEKYRVRFIKAAGLLKRDRSLATMYLIMGCPNEAQKVIEFLEKKDKAGPLPKIFAILYDVNELRAAELYDSCKNNIRRKKFDQAKENLDELFAERIVKTKFFEKHTEEVDSMRKQIESNLDENNRHPEPEPKPRPETGPKERPSKPVAKTTQTKWIEDDYDAALKKAKSENKHVFLVFSGSDWCGWCIKYNKEILSKRQFMQKMSQYYVLVVLDYPRTKKQPARVVARNKTILNKFGVRGYPSAFLCKPDGKPYHKTGCPENINLKNYMEYIMSHYEANK